MKLFRHLFYVLLLIPISVISGICCFETTSHCNLIAIGLITGAFVALINTLVNYVNVQCPFSDKYIYVKHTSLVATK